MGILGKAMKKVAGMITKKNLLGPVFFCHRYVYYFNYAIGRTDTKSLGKLGNFWLRILNCFDLLFNDTAKSCSHLLLK
jgi:hypothetical protein